MTTVTLRDQAPSSNASTRGLETAAIPMSRRAVTPTARYLSRPMPERPAATSK
jgi:hypothetical protein